MILFFFEISYVLYMFVENSRFFSWVSFYKMEGPWSFGLKTQSTGKKRRAFVKNISDYRNLKSICLRSCLRCVKKLTHTSVAYISNIFKLQRIGNQSKLIREVKLISYFELRTYMHYGDQMKITCTTCLQPLSLYYLFKCEKIAIITK